MSTRAQVLCVRGGSYLMWESEKGFLGTKSGEDP